MQHLVAESLPIVRRMGRGGQGRHQARLVVGRVQLVAHQRRNALRQFVDVLLPDPFNYLHVASCLYRVAGAARPGRPTPSHDRYIEAVWLDRKP